MAVYTLEQLNQLDENRSKVLASVSEQMNTLSAQIEARKADKITASIAGDIEKVTALVKEIKSLEDQLESGYEMIEVLKTQREYNDDDVAESTKAVCDNLSATYAGMQAEYNKARNALYTVYEKMKDAAAAADREYRQVKAHFTNPDYPYEGRGTLPDYPDGYKLRNLFREDDSKQ